MRNHATPRNEYDVKPRRMSGTDDDAAPRTHALAVTVTLILLLAALVLLLGAHPAHAQTGNPTAAASPLPDPFWRPTCPI